MQLNEVRVAFARAVDKLGGVYCFLGLRNKHHIVSRRMHVREELTFLNRVPVKNDGGFPERHERVAEGPLNFSQSFLSFHDSFKFTHGKNSSLMSF